MTAHQLRSTSGDVWLQAVKSGYVEGFSNPTVESGAPDPSGPWHPAHPASKRSAPISPVAGRDCAASGDANAMKTRTTRAGRRTRHLYTSKKAGAFQAFPWQTARPSQRP